MTIGVTRTKLRKGHAGRFRPLKVGEEIQANDISVGPDWYEHVAESQVGQPCEKRDTIIRLEFEQ